MSGILILSATEWEVAGFLSRFPGARRQILKSGGILFIDPGRTPAWQCLVTGPGVFNTAMVLSGYLERCTPDLILDTGIAGVFKPSGLGIGDVGVAVRDRYIHTGVGDDPFSLAPIPFDLIPGCPSTRHGEYDLDRGTADLWAGRLAKCLGSDQARVAPGPFVTVSAITGTLDHAQALFQRFSPIMESMEGAAVAHVAACYGVDLVEIRVASNMVGERDKTKWAFDLARDRVGIVCGIVLN